MHTSRRSRGLTALVLVAFALAAAVAVLSRYLPVSGGILMATRWILAATLVAFAIQRRSLTTWILVSTVVGGVFGYDFPQHAVKLQVLSQIFLRLIKTIIAPLIFSTLVVGIAGHSNLKQVGRMGLKALIYFEVVTTLALFIGLAAINISKAGVGAKLQAAPSAQLATAPARPTASDIILHVFPENIAKSVADGQVLQVVVFSIIFAMALALIPGDKRQPLLTLCGSLSETMFKFTNIVMYFAPIGVGAAMAFTVGQLGLGVLVNLLKLLLTLYGALIVFVFGVLLPVALIARVPVRRFAKAAAEPFSIAFATSTSEAALPRAMEAMEALGVPRKIVAFVIPTGYSFNMDGSTLYLALASIFVAQAAGVQLDWRQQLVMVFTLMLTSKGVAGVPRATLVILLGTLAAFNLPAEPVFIILGIDALMDMARTSINVLGNCLASVVIARWEGEFEKEPLSPVVQEAALVE
jgi:Na+/H+-dicarboxylate symporter